MGGLIDWAYLVSVDDLRDTRDALNDGKREYKLTCDTEKTVVVSYNDEPDDLRSGDGNDLREGRLR